MSSSRTDILTRLRQSQLRAVLPEPAQGLPDGIAPKKLDPTALLERLQAEFKLLGVETYVENSEEAVRQRVKGLITQKSILSWDANQLPYDAGQCLEGEKVYFGHDSKNDQATAEIGLTSCEAVLAETGSQAMISGPGKPRTASLLPYTHVVVIRRSSIVFGMGEFLQNFKSRELLPYLVFITGPSRTADIALVIALGVHGPGKIIAVIGP
jgi:L-lactate dehydrogenase complex protein LldG